MEGVRFRKDQHAASLGYERLSSSHSSRRGSRRLRTALYGCAGAAALLLCVLLAHNLTPLGGGGHAVGWLDTLSVPLGLQQRVHAVVLDAGSTGSRVLAFTFLRSVADNSLRLEGQLWHEVKPGLSSYADDPAKGAASLAPLLALAAGRVPASARPHTPLVLKATAGLRLLPEAKAQGLLDHVRQTLEGSEFQTDDKCVQIMDGKYEGIFSWFTLNYLMDRVGSPAAQTFAALDLGGGSTQVTFVPTEAQTLSDAREGQLAEFQMMGQPSKLFTHSYLGLGLMAARHAVLPSEQNASLLRSPCVSPAVQTEWSYGGRTYLVAGMEEHGSVQVPGREGHLGETLPTADYDACHAKCVQVIRQQVSWVPPELGRREVVAFSYFFDRATERGLIDPTEGGTVTVSALTEAARSACLRPNADQPFACLDLTFIETFLREGYGLPPHREVKLHKKVDGYDLSWALGLAFHIVTNNA